MPLVTQEIYLHIGIKKTGTSAIQFFLSTNRQRLLNYHNIVYPELEKDRHAHHGLALPYVSAHKRKGSPPKIFFRDLISYFEKYPKKTFLLSSEAFASSEDIQKLKDNLEALNIFPKIIVYLRRQDYWLESRYNQDIKSGDKKNFTDFCSEQQVDWFRLLQKWEQVFGRENLIIKVYENQQMPQGLIADFLQILGITEIDGFEVPSAKRNISLDLDLLELKRLANMMNYSIELSVLNKINEKLQCFSQNRYLFSLEERQKIIKKYADSNSQVAKKYLGRKKLFYEDALKSENQYKHYSGLVLEKVVVIFLLIMQKQSSQKQSSQKQSQKQSSQKQSSQKQYQQQIQEQQRKVKRYKKKLRRSRRLSMVFAGLFLLQSLIILYLLL
ncbi:hypothetical protein [Candidatus Uabimicrobium sp. HlEnr_7]|uniref:hypothetical protein n=1 Tax=Candidatus Uabimicrobium helgolandensis TaxID=3095367 RepID=UPI003557271C